MHPHVQDNTEPRRRCPHCGQKMRDARLDVALSRTMTRVFDAVQTAGPSGITVAEINAAVFDGKVTPNNVRLHLSQINRLLWETCDMQIKGNTPSRGRFCLIRRGRAA